MKKFPKLQGGQGLSRMHDSGTPISPSSTSVAILPLNGFQAQAAFLIPPYTGSIQIQPLYGYLINAEIYYYGSYALLTSFTTPLDFSGPLGWGCGIPFSSQPFLLIYHGIPSFMPSAAIIYIN